MRLGIFGRGRLGSAIAEAAGSELAWQVAREEPPTPPVDVAVDASAAAAVAAHLDWALEHRVDLVIAATGWALPDLRERVGERIGVLVAPNLSLGVALLRRLAVVLGRWAALDPDRDPYIVEHHHRMKADAPSGTARALADAILDELSAGTPGDRPAGRVLARGQGTQRRQGPAHGDGPAATGGGAATRLKRPASVPAGVDGESRSPAPRDLSIAVLRAGVEVGTHTVGVDSPVETIEITHRARSRQVFARGALEAARFIQGRRGVFGLDDFARKILDPLFRFEDAP